MEISHLCGRASRLARDNVCIVVLMRAFVVYEFPGESDDQILAMSDADI
jgi:hypothetical protein